MSNADVAVPAQVTISTRLERGYVVPRIRAPLNLGTVHTILLVDLVAQPRLRILCTHSGLDQVRIYEQHALWGQGGGWVV